MDLTLLAPIAPAAGGAAIVWLWRRVRQHLRFSMDLQLRIRAGDKDN